MAVLNPCKDRKTALAVIGTISGAMEPGTQKAALDSVAEWIQTIPLEMPGTPEEQEARILEMKTSLRKCMSVEERREEAVFYLEGIEA